MPLYQQLKETSKQDIPLISCAAQIQKHPFIHSFHWHVQNAMIPCRSQQLLPFLSVMYFFLPPFSTNYSSILSHPHLAIYFLFYLSILLFPNSYLIRFWEFYFLPFSVHAQTNIIYLTLLSLLQQFFNTCINFFIG